MQGFVGPVLYVGLYRPCTIGRAVQDLHNLHGFAGPALYVGLYRPCTICKAV